MGVLKLRELGRRGGGRGKEGGGQRRQKSRTEKIRTDDLTETMYHT